jgi:catechol 2,3-dioxygenase-like lactoylglutathione lyase family enzyme
MIKGFAHICFNVSDLDASIAFYRKLGFAPAFEFLRDNGERYGIYLHIGGRCFIELFKGELAAPAEKQSYKHFCLEVDDIEATAGELRTRGIKVGEIKLGKDQSFQAWLADPDGNRIELHQYTPQSKQAICLNRAK